MASPGPGASQGPSAAAPASTLAPAAGCGRSLAGDADGQSQTFTSYLKARFIAHGKSQLQQFSAVPAAGRLAGLLEG